MVLEIPSNTTGTMRLASICASNAFVITTVTIAIFVDQFLYGLVIPILPTLLADRAHVPASKVQGTLSGLLAAYNASTVVCAPIAGVLADRWLNRKIPLLGGLVAIAGATVLFMLSRIVGLLYLARILQGAAASIVWAAGLALLVDSVGPERMGPAMGIVSLGLSLGNTTGPLIGGVIYQHAGQYPTFILAFAIIAVDVVMRCLVRESRSEVATPPGAPQSLPDAAPTESHMKSGEREEVREHLDVQSSRPKTAAAKSQPPGLFSIFKLLKHPDLLTSLWYVFLITVVLTGLEAVIPLHVERTFGWDTQGAGLIFLALVIPIFLSPLIGHIYSKYSARPLSTSGFLLATIFGPLLALIRSQSIGLIILLVVFLVFIGIGVSLVMTPEMAEISIFSEMKAEQDPGLFGPSGATAQCCALMTVATAAGGIVGPLVSGAIQNASGWVSTSIALGAFAALGLGTLLLKASWDKKKGQPQTSLQAPETQIEENIKSEGVHESLT